MVPKADSGTFLLLFLLVLSITEPLRPGTGAGKGHAAGRGRPRGEMRGLKGPPPVLLGASESFPE